MDIHCHLHDQKVIKMVFQMDQNVTDKYIIESVFDVLRLCEIQQLKYVACYEKKENTKFYDFSSTHLNNLRNEYINKHINLIF